MERGRVKIKEDALGTHLSLSRILTMAFMMALVAWFAFIGIGKRLNNTRSNGSHTNSKLELT